MNSNYKVYALCEGELVRDLYLGWRGQEEADSVAKVRYMDGIAVDTDGRFVQMGDKFQNGAFYKFADEEWKMIKREPKPKDDGSKKVIEKQKARIEYLEGIIKENKIKL